MRCTIALNNAYGGYCSFAALSFLPGPAYGGGVSVSSGFRMENTTLSQNAASAQAAATSSRNT